MAAREDPLIGVVGAGAMGRGIAQIAAAAGLRVVLVDASQAVVLEAREFIERMLLRAAAKGRTSEAQAREAAGRVSAGDGLADLARCQVVVEAIVEDLDAKRHLFRELEVVVDDDCILATNTSSLSVTAIGAALRRPERLAGCHFFNPVPLMPLAEIVSGMRTAPGVRDALADLVRRTGHHAVHAADTPGFIVNHAGRGYGTEALRIAAEGIAAFADVDRLMREAAGFRMGPFELLDLTGLDVSHPVMESIYHQYYEEPRFRPSVITRRRLEGGALGRKSGGGFYAYRDGRAVVAPEPEVPRDPDLPVWVSRREARGGGDLARLLEAGGARLESGARPSPRALCLVTPLGEDATAAALAEGLDAARTVAVDTLTDLAGRRTVMSTPVTEPDYRDAARALLARDGTPVSAIHDSPGFVVQRILAAIVNIGAEMAQQRVATPEDIDRSVVVALGYPRGPLGLGDALGPGRVLRILEAMQRLYGDPRYRPSPWLRRRARLGVSLLTPEGP